MQDCLQLTSEQKAEMARLRAECLAKQGENKAQWHQLCNAMAEVGLPQFPLLFNPQMQLVTFLYQSAQKSNFYAVLPAWCYMMQHAWQYISLLILVYDILSRHVPLNSLLK